MLRWAIIVTLVCGGLGGVQTPAALALRSLDHDVAPPPGRLSLLRPPASQFRVGGAGSGFLTFDTGDSSVFSDLRNYTLRLVTNGQGDVETMRSAAQVAAAQVSAAGGAVITVAAGTVADIVPDREPIAGEILMSVDSTSPCSGSWAGCGGPRLFSYRAGQSTTIDSGRMWIHPLVIGYTAAQRNHVVAHELGHAVGLDHFSDTYQGENQVMHPSAYDAVSYRAGDRNGLSFLADLNPPANITAPTVSVTGPEPTVNIAQSSAPGTWQRSPTSYSYQWKTCYQSVCAAVAGATASTYTPRAVDEGKRLTVTIVATNQWGSSAPATSAQSPTIVVARPATWAVQAAETQQQALYYVASGGQVATKYFNGSAWGGGTLGMGQPAAAASTPVAVRNGITQQQSVYYVGADQHIWTWFFNGSDTWTNSRIGTGDAVAPGTSVVAIRVPNSGQQALYYIGSDQQIWTWYFNGATWSNGRIGTTTGQPAGAHTTPALVRDPTTGQQALYYIGSDQQIWSWYFNGATWSNGRIGTTTGQPADPGTSPTVIQDPANQHQSIYYVGSDHQIWSWYFDGAWSNSRIGVSQAADASTTPTVVRSKVNQQQALYYVGSDHQIWSWFFDGTNPTPWTSGRIGTNPGQAADSHTAPALVLDPVSAAQALYYTNASHQIWSWYFNGANPWVNGSI